MSAEGARRKPNLSGQRTERNEEQGACSCSPGVAVVRQLFFCFPDRYQRDGRIEYRDYARSEKIGRRNYASNSELLYRPIEHGGLAVHLSALRDDRRRAADGADRLHPVPPLWLRHEKHRRQNVQKDRGRQGRRYAPAGGDHGPGGHGGHRQHCGYLSGHCPGRLRRGVLAVAGGPDGHGGQVLGGDLVHPLPPAG